MTDARARELVAQLAGQDLGAAEDAWLALAPLGAAVAPLLLEQYRATRGWQGRVTLVFHATRFARTSDAARRLGLEALRDRSYMVRYRACGLLAYAQDPDAVAELRPLLEHRDARTVEDADAAIAALEERNHHLFVDRRRTGQVVWSVVEGDLPA